MAEDIFLERLRVRQFRSFADLDIKLDPKPGVLIVHGSNGLGKSSLFQGIEWLMTDRIDQFRDADGVKKVGRYLCRWRKPADAETSIGMAFSDGREFKRSLANRRSSKSVLSGIDDVAAYLRSDRWTTPIRNLSHYLLLTHILAQTNLSRLAYRKDAERFGILKDAAHSQAESQIGRNLHGPGTTVQARAFNTTASRLTSEANEFGRLLDQEAAAWDESQIAGAISDDAASAQAGEIVSLVETTGYGAATGDGSTEPNALADLIEAAQSQALRRRADLTQAAALRARYAEMSQGRAALAAELLAMQTSAAGLPDAIDKRAAERAAATTRLSEATAALVDAIGRVRQVGELRSAYSAAAKFEQELAGISVAANGTAQQRRGAETQVVKLEREGRLVERLKRQADIVSDDITLKESEIVQIAELVEAHVEVSFAKIELQQLEAASPTLADDLVKANADVDAYRPVVESLQISVAALRDATGAISAAVVEIVNHLPVDACECPVCATTFATPDELSRRATSAAARLAPELERQQSALDAASDRLRNAVETIQGLRNTAQSLASARSNLAWRQDLLSKRIAAAGRNEVEPTLTALNAESNAIELRLDRLRRARARLRRWQLRFEARSDERSAALRWAMRERDMAEAAVQAGERLRADLVSRLAERRSEITRLAVALFGIEAVDEALLAEAEVALDATAERARTEQEVAQAAAAAIDAEFNRLEAQRAAIRAQQIAVTSRLEGLEADQAILRTHWNTLPGIGAIDAHDGSVIAAADQALAEAVETLANAAAKLETLRTGRLAWAQRQSHASLIEQLRVAVEGAANAGRDDLRKTAEAKREARLRRRDRVLEAKRIAEIASGRIDEELKAFSAEYIRPLDTLTRRINRSILCDPRIGIRLKVGTKGVKQAAVKEDEPLADFGDIDAKLVHSEGQMAALGVSMLCAASLTFPWSRWKALILDDPLQHNDAIHSAAFADFMGNLVEARDYQILLSTHDAAQAEFLQRKFRARSIPCMTVSLLGMGALGVEEDIRRPLEAAG